jgi:hypothetical protein
VSYERNTRKERIEEIKSIKKASEMQFSARQVNRVNRVIGFVELEDRIGACLIMKTNMARVPDSAREGP